MKTPAPHHAAAGMEAARMSKDTTWYVVADGGKARILTLQGNDMHTLQHFDNSGHGNTDEDASAGTSQLKAPKSDPHDQAKSHFAKQVADRLNEAVRSGKVGEIMLAAPSHVLHDIREHLDKAASGTLGKVLSKDLTNTPDHELASHFA
jgi:protein required for attachment to host cells